MSAYVVSKEHIDVLVSAIWEDDKSFNPDEIGKVLWNQNYRSVNYRYDEQTKIPEYCFSKPEHRLNPVEILKLCSCYNYQSCETDDYESTDAFMIIDKLIHVLIRKLPGYEDAPWGI